MNVYAEKSQLNLLFFLLMSARLTKSYCCLRGVYTWQINSCEVNFPLNFSPLIDDCAKDGGEEFVSKRHCVFPNQISMELLRIHIRKQYIVEKILCCHL